MEERLLTSALTIFTRSERFYLSRSARGAFQGRAEAASVRCGGVRLTVASEGAVASGVIVFELATGVGRDVEGIEIDKPGLVRHAMRIMTGGAGRLLFHDMKAMTAILPAGVKRGKALVRQDAVAIMAFVTESISAEVFRAAIGQNQFPLQNRRVDGAVRTVRAAPESSGALVIVMAVGAIDAARDREWGNEARHIRIFPADFDGMEGGIFGPEFLPCVRLHKMPWHAGLASGQAIGMASKAEFVLGTDR